MPRKADKGLDQRILKAAQRLWHTHGERGLTLRAVAREAHTTTTTVYKRFRNKAEIEAALAERVRARFAEVLVKSSSVEEACRRYLHFARNHPREYRLLYGPAWVAVMGQNSPRPAKAWLQNRLAVRFGGRAQDYDGFFSAIFLLTHGAASLIAATPAAREAKEAEENCVTFCDLLVRDAHLRQRVNRALRRHRK
jgi:AcrR family transcriptional regulator